MVTLECQLSGMFATSALLQTKAVQSAEMRISYLSEPEPFPSHFSLRILKKVNQNRWKKKSDLISGTDLFSDPWEAQPTGPEWLDKQRSSLTAGPFTASVQLLDETKSKQRRGPPGRRSGRSVQGSEMWEIISRAITKLHPLSGSKVHLKNCLQTKQKRQSQRFLPLSPTDGHELRNVML